MAGWLNAERTRCGFGMQEALQLTAIDQAKTAGRCALTIEGCGTDMAGMETVVMQGEKWNGHPFTDRVTVAQADPIQH